MSLFDGFPEELQQQKIDGWIVPGAIVRIECSWVMKHNKTKYVIIVAAEPCIVFMVNTNAPRDPHVSTQVELLEPDYPGVIDHNCWVNCNAALDAISIAEIKQQVKNNSQCYRGQLRAAEIKSIIHAMVRADGISPRQRRSILHALTALAS